MVGPRGLMRESKALRADPMLYHARTVGYFECWPAGAAGWTGCWSGGTVTGEVQRMFVKFRTPCKRSSKVFGASAWHPPNS